MSLKQPSERPYEATRYTYLTDTQGLTAVESNDIILKKLSEKKEAYEGSAKDFQTEDEKARSAYKDSGSVVDNGFLDWAQKNHPGWINARSQLSDNIVHLHMISRHVFGKPYDDQVEKGKEEDKKKAYETGFLPSGGHY